MEKLLAEIRKCTECEQYLPFGCRPVLDASVESRILVIGQAPGNVVHRTGIPWNDASGKNLRNWLDVDSDTFYDVSKFGIVPMGFCYPGTGKSGDLPPRKECAPLWHEALLEKMPNVELVLLIGNYAQKYYLSKKRNPDMAVKKNLTTTVMHYKEYLPLYFPLPHPSPRNNIWQKKNPWFKAEVLPALKKRIKKGLK